MNTRLKPFALNHIALICGLGHVSGQDYDSLLGHKPTSVSSLHTVSTQSPFFFLFFFLLERRVEMFQCLLVKAIHLLLHKRTNQPNKVTSLLPLGLIMSPEHFSK